MDQASLPLPLLKIFLRAMPVPLLERALTILVRKMERRHARLFTNLARLAPAVVFIEPEDVGHRFALVYGGGASTTLSLVEATTPNPSAVIKGDLVSLIDMLEARSDGDTLFFSRQIAVSGDTTVIVGLRNTLDREKIDLMTDITSLFGPFARPARRVMTGLGGLLQRVRESVADSHQALHRAQKAVDPELQEVKKRLAACEQALKRQEGRAA